MPELHHRACPRHKDNDLPYPCCCDEIAAEYAEYQTELTFASMHEEERV